MVLRTKNWQENWQKEKETVRGRKREKGGKKAQEVQITVRWSLAWSQQELNSFLGVFLSSLTTSVLSFSRELPGALSTQTILIWLNTWFILSLRWGKLFVLIGPVNLQNPFRAIYWQACLNLSSPRSASAACCNGRELQFSIYPPNEKKST